MQFKAFYTNHSGWQQLFLLLMLLLAGTILSSVLGLGLFFLVYGYSASLFQHPDMLRFSQLLSAVGTFVLPSLVLAWLCSRNPKEYLWLNKAPGILFSLLGFVCLLLLSPLINLADMLNKQLVLPDFLRAVEDWMRTNEEAAQQLTNLFLADKDIVSFLYNLLIIAVVAAIGEEFFFRGAVQRVIGKWTANPHLVIWLTAILFSAFHLQFYGFLPRMILGAFLGYLLYWSGSIWVPVLIHFANNTIAIITLSDSQLSQNTYLTGNLTNEQILPYILIAVVTTSLFFFLARMMQKKKKTTKEEEI